MRFLGLVVLISVLLALGPRSVCQTVPSVAPDTPSSSAAPHTAAAPIDRKEIVRQARRAYYNLPAAGFTEFRCEVRADWDFIYSQLEIDAVGRNLLPTLKQMHFQVVVGPDGASTVTHQSEIAPPDEQLAERTRKSASGMEQILTGFFHTWTLFAIKSPLPEVEADYELAMARGQYQLKYREGTSDVFTSMDHNFAIEELSVSMPDFTGSVRPKLRAAQNGFMLTSYDATYKTGETAPATLSVKVEYREVEGFQLPHVVTATTPFGKGLLTIPLTFSVCKAKKR